MHPSPATSWQLRTRRLDLRQRPLLMGILNVTPDSFSDGGKFHRLDHAVERGMQLIDEGADILDIGGESTRPNAAPVELEEEQRRVIPVVERLAHVSSVPLSIDTSKSVIAREAVDAGAEIINDVTGLEGDPLMIEVARQSGVGVCAMHMRGTPQTMQDNPTYHDLIGQIGSYLLSRRDVLLEHGMPLEKICLDPGVGFGKTHQHNLELLANCHAFHQFGCPLLVGPSRKGFLGKVLQDKNADRAAATIGVALALCQQKVQVIRVHDVRLVHEALVSFQAVGGIDGRPLQLPTDA